jgi:hypothetical protein
VFADISQEARGFLEAVCNVRLYEEVAVKSLLQALLKSSGSGWILWSCGQRTALSIKSTALSLPDRKLGRCSSSSRP